jgi:hypothetical protein
MILTRVPPHVLTALDQWIEACPDDPKPTRPEAIRRILKNFFGITKVARKRKRKHS